MMPWPFMPNAQPYYVMPAQGNFPGGAPLVMQAPAASMCPAMHMCPPGYIQYAQASYPPVAYASAGYAPNGAMSAPQVMMHPQLVASPGGVALPEQQALTLVDDSVSRPADVGAATMPNSVQVHAPTVSAAQAQTGQLAAMAQFQPNNGNGVLGTQMQQQQQAIAQQAGLWPYSANFPMVGYPQVNGVPGVDGMAAGNAGAGVPSMTQSPQQLQHTKQLQVLASGGSLDGVVPGAATQQMPQGLPRAAQVGQTDRAQSTQADAVSQAQADAMAIGIMPSQQMMVPHPTPTAPPNA